MVVRIVTMVEVEGEEDIMQVEMGVMLRAEVEGEVMGGQVEAAAIM